MSALAEIALLITGNKAMNRNLISAPSVTILYSEFNAHVFSNVTVVVT
jgi:hypothetical protein